MKVVMVVLFLFLFFGFLGVYQCERSQRGAVQQQRLEMFMQGESFIILND